jgi:hypothetical protein
MTSPHSTAQCLCGCCTAARRLPRPIPGLIPAPAPTLDLPNVTRRTFIQSVGALTAGGLALPSILAKSPESVSDDPRRPLGPQPLRVQPVLTYEIPQRREATSWRSWGGIQTEADAEKERARIDKDLASIPAKPGCPVQFQPVALVRSMPQARQILANSYDALLLFAAGGGGDLLEAMVRPERPTLMFLRHDPGPAYLWYEIVHPRFLRKTVDAYAKTGMDVDDVVVDRLDTLETKLRALAALKNAVGKRIVCIGGPAGWGEGGRQAPDISRNLWKLDLIDFPYKDLEPRLKAAFQNTALVERSAAAARGYLGRSGVRLETRRDFVDNAFVLHSVFKDILAEAKTDAITVNNCMGTIMGMSRTTACLPLSLLNDEGYLAFCESDFVVIPSGILLHYIAGKPVFLNDPTYPHGDIVTLAHCTAPRRMDGNRLEKTRLLTHFESDYGVAPKVEMKLGQVCTNLVPDFACKQWVGFRGTIVANPFHDICRSQIDVRIHGNATALLEEMKGFHWMLSYGDHLAETGYALHKLGVQLHNVSAA